MTKTKHDYLMTLIRELEKEGNATKLDNFIIAVEDLLQVKYRLRNYFDYPISEPQYDELIEKAETLLGVDPSTSGRTNGATSADGASNGLNPDQWIAFTAKQDIKKGDFVLIDEHDNQSVTPAADMEISKTSLKDMWAEFKNAPDPDTFTADPNVDYERELDAFYDLSNEVMKEYKEAYAVLASRDDGYHSGAIYSQDEIKYHMGQAPDGYKMIWYFSPFEQFFVGDITGMNNFPFIYKDSDPSYNDYVRNTAVVGPFHSVEELEKYFDLLVHENAGVDDGFIKDLTELVAAIKFYESRNDTAKYDTIIDSLWSALKTFLMGNI